MTSLGNLLKEGRIESVEPDVAVAKDKLEEAKRHLASAAAIAEDDPEGAYSLVYDAARKAGEVAMLANGYRASKSKVGAHEAMARYVEAVIGGKYLVRTHFPSFLEWRCRPSNSPGAAAGPRPSE